ncbi:DNA-damage inducible protein DDI1-like protein [Trypanosoma rangeli]|uniref:DNA-damage inducible protein DDI1-like protein n=1 Tax=Trypanosoma rangeli TaxID=5698 RepID=A0A3R7MKK5_TRYRA|nr:DNA-damage inducible protein DDI1-like protein [Trypanosoma rangeli]RNF04178.1 DNA-damage inducible protein DDI1-like protein [Trypanosoma rangeli]|eukprot:RNF04178.1 DNA-damage inducible protein DDI1-like protein [Trypanosoma rangeli]
MIHLLCTTESGESCTIEIDPRSLVEDMAALIEVELGIPMLEQVLIADDDTVLQGNMTLASQGICADASVRVIHSARTHDEGRPRQRGEGEGTPVDALPSPGPEAHAVRQQGPARERQLHQHGLDSGHAPTSEDSQRGHSAALKDHRSFPHLPGEARARIEQLFAQGPGQLSGGAPLRESDPEVQRRIYEAIYWENVNENLESAYEFMPEFFVQVPMLFVNCEVNAVKVKAFIDSGAQRSIMNRRTAEHCGLMRLLDTRAASIMRGIGVRRTLGVIHMVIVNLGGLHVPLSLTVIDDDKIDFIIGLDQMKLHRMIIDLRDNCLRVADTQIPFLPDSEVPDFVTGNEVVDEDAQEEEAKQQQRGTSKPLATASTLAKGLKTKGQPDRQANMEGMGRATVTSTTNASGAGSTPAQGPAAFVDKERAIAAVMTYTRMDREGAVTLLEAAGWNVDLAVSLFIGE